MTGRPWLSWRFGHSYSSASVSLHEMNIRDAPASD
jgi:hypothetical protein